ncbi:hypothetical protein SE15_10495 [Thermanaerothrix daxensis]|uniref:Uncharacterized protein n=1 Tax=Thermanaerothrix daxensis TaxID=869279 RepID=A0A0P6XH34_9CHLR|nr:hypothetical protein [Thermanaerothrix daxensis]KPL82547.1 hypothetical protein SE15_10495 [Thermanaerothrix daxensis]
MNSRSFSFTQWFSELAGRLRLRPGFLFGIIILTALVAFEIFNYSTTDYALRDLLGGLSFAGLQWSTILAIAFCGIDFAGIARLFTPEQGSSEPKEVWYLFGAWLLAATFNALLTWWGVSMAIVSHTPASTSVIDRETLITVVPIFVAMMVWVIRILIIGTLSVAGERLFSTGDQPLLRTPLRTPRPAATTGPTVNSSAFAPRPTPTPTNLSARSTTAPSRPEPTYHSLNARPSRSNEERSRTLL